MNRRTPPIHFETIRSEDRIQRSTRRERQIADDLDNNIRKTVASIYAPLTRQASDVASLVVLVLFIGTIALLAQLAVGN